MGAVVIVIMLGQPDQDSARVWNSGVERQRKGSMETCGLKIKLWQWVMN